MHGENVMRVAIGTWLVRVGLRLRGGRGRHSKRPHDPLHPTPLTRSETAAVLDQRARRSLGMSGEEFRQKLEAGTLPDTPTVRNLSTFIGPTG